MRLHFSARKHVWGINRPADICMTCALLRYSLCTCSHHVSRMSLGEGLLLIIRRIGPTSPMSWKSTDHTILYFRSPYIAFIDAVITFVERCGLPRSANFFSFKQRALQSVSRDIILRPQWHFLQTTCLLLNHVQECWVSWLGVHRNFHRPRSWLQTQSLTDRAGRWAHLRCVPHKAGRVIGASLSRHDEHEAL